ncbi:hypothetical protein AB0J83_22305 [Actinoplanes sp. NPDC049596]|uniref:hypothetical protein n=1 Tax=unclassified Actinoplanes TaxID=2626549 RepID=UPI00344AFC83
MSFWSKLKRKRDEQLERTRQEAYLKATARGATPEEARKAADRAARSGTNSAINGAINS